MTNLVFHTDYNKLPIASKSVIPVQIYGNSGRVHGNISIIGNSILKEIQKLGILITTESMDFLSIALSVIAADTFVLRSDSPDGWTRELSITLPLKEPDKWIAIKPLLEKALNFLSGDLWHFKFTTKGISPPNPFIKKNQIVNLNDNDCVSLFSGGLDSAIGAIDLLHGNRNPIFVSHAYTGDKKHQDLVANLIPGKFSRFSLNAYPVSHNKKTDITMRTRSLSFLAFGAIAASAIQKTNGIKNIQLFVPENGFISLNVPLTNRRIGSLSTRTTHPHFINLVQEIFNQVGISCTLINPYQFYTKGDMIIKCQDSKILKRIIDKTVSCSHWKRKHIQCGICVPCIIRRSAVLKSNFKKDTKYLHNNLKTVLNDSSKKDDLISLLVAIEKKKNKSWLIDTGPLPKDKLNSFEKIFSSALLEIESFLTTNK